MATLLSYLLPFCSHSVSSDLRDRDRRGLSRLGLAVVSVMILLRQVLNSLLVSGSNIL